MKSNDVPMHMHCPNDCEKPQPFQAEYADGTVKWFCGRCLHEGRGYVQTYACTPVTCPGDA